MHGTTNPAAMGGSAPEELASSILLDEPAPDADPPYVTSGGANNMQGRARTVGGGPGAISRAPGSSNEGRSIQRENAPHRTPTRTPSPENVWQPRERNSFPEATAYHTSPLLGPQMAPVLTEEAESSCGTGSKGLSGWQSATLSATSPEFQAQGFCCPGMGFQPMMPANYWPPGVPMNMVNQQLSYNLLMNSQVTSGGQGSGQQQDGDELQLADPLGTTSETPTSAGFGGMQHTGSSNNNSGGGAGDAAGGGKGGGGGALLANSGGNSGEPKRNKIRTGSKGGAGGTGGGGGGGNETRLQVSDGDPVAFAGAKGASMAQSPAGASRDRDRGSGGKGDRRRGKGDQALQAMAGGGGEKGGRGGRDGRGYPDEDRGGKPSRVDGRQVSSPIIESLKARERPAELSELLPHIGEIAQDQWGSRLIQQKLGSATQEEKQRAFQAIITSMPQLMTDVFGNYVIQKFFEYGDPQQKKILAEHLLGSVLKLSMQMYGCRVVQKAIESVQTEQQVLLVGELKGKVIDCVEDQHGNHVIQKCIERLPTDKINFIVEAFDGQVMTMAKHCYGCRVIQRLIEYCTDVQLSRLLDEVVRNVQELATDQYGNYVVQHVLEHSQRPHDRPHLLKIVADSILALSCHKYASNVVEKALHCGTPEERAIIIGAIISDNVATSQPHLNSMMKDKFGNYIVQRSLNFAQGDQRDQLLRKVEVQMPALKKSNTYGKHIIAAYNAAKGNAA